MANKIRIAIDRGGTFTDLWAKVPGKKEDLVIKLLSVDPSNYPDAPTEGIRRVLEIARGQKIPRGQPLQLHDVESIRMGTTVATNALLERKGEKSALLITKGFKDLLVIGNQARPNIFDLSVARPGVLYSDVIEVNERVTLEDFTEDPEHHTSEANSDDLVKGLSGEVVRIIQKPDLAMVERDLLSLKERGFKSIAICFIHSFTFPEHEFVVAKIARSIGFKVSVSSQLQPMIKAVPRGHSSTADAYLTPITQKYIDGFSKGFEGGLDAAAAHGTRCEFMQSDGGLVDYRKFSGLKAILSGPAGGVVGYAQTSFEGQNPVIGFDMGGTSTDVSRFDGSYDHVFETTTAGITIQCPQLDINTVAAGGGSRLFWSNGMFKVGPQSAGAHPGPACYRKGGPLTVTDANLFLGRLLPEHFPSMFGPNEDEPLDVALTKELFTRLTSEINSSLSSESHLTAEQVASGFLRVADEAMCRPIRTLTEARGHDVSDHILASFGGAGGQHACSIAAALSIKQVVIHRYSSILSAYGMALADVVTEVQEPEAMNYDSENAPKLRERLRALQERATDELVEQGFQTGDIKFEKYLNMRYQGSDTALMIMEPEHKDYEGAFVERHRQEFGFVMNRNILVDDVRVRGIAGTQGMTEVLPSEQLKSLKFVTPEVVKSTPVFFEGMGWQDTPTFLLDRVPAGALIEGPAMIIDNTQTIVVIPSAVARVLPRHVIIDIVGAEKKQVTAENVDPIQLSIFGHRFMSIAEQMGRTLQKTSISTNIKERLDFSCALFSDDGRLVANAPHVPVHLGSMQYAVIYQHNYWKGKLKPGDVLVSNHPQSGGSHLPDITVITPVFDNAGNKILFYVGSRGHHADIGGISAGSMPPSSKELWQEGASIRAFKLVSGSKFDEEGIVDLLLHQPSKYPGCSGARNIQDNLSDLCAQVAANQKGINLIHGLIDEYGYDVVIFYMYAIQQNAEIAVRTLLKRTYEQHGGQPLEAVDYMDDGTPIKLRITIDKDTGSAVFDFTGTGPEVYGNWNAPESVCNSALIYVLRSLISSDIPLNQGCLTPVKVIIPPKSLLSPSAGAAVVGGNVLTSQRATDVILKAFGACAASQGCLNNLTFGKGGKDDKGNVVRGFGYYETIAGGAGAGPTWNGTSGVHVHMTNTRITDPEILEKRYPVILREFSIRKDSGGKGLHPGGDGCTRIIEFRTDMNAGILSDRRVHQPYGMAGGAPGEAGRNLWVTHDGVSGEERVINIGGKNAISAKQGDQMIIHTPAGGGWGHAGLDGLNGIDGSMSGNGVLPNEEVVQHFRASGSVAAYQSQQRDF